ncbi:hypothetical protein B0H14DRAFT_2573875 [Mycena olivaceomarginata]|nr:hypothetical protein B0H14DRAFT_2573875 [Mycena olivaceomarginata]
MSHRVEDLRLGSNRDRECEDKWWGRKAFNRRKVRNRMGTNNTRMRLVRGIRFFDGDGVRNTMRHGCRHRDVEELRGEARVRREERPRGDSKCAATPPGCRVIGRGEPSNETRRKVASNVAKCLDRSS